MVQGWGLKYGITGRTENQTEEKMESKMESESIWEFGLGGLYSDVVGSMIETVFWEMFYSGSWIIRGSIPNHPGVRIEVTGSQALTIREGGVKGSDGLAWQCVWLSTIVVPGVTDM